MTNSTSSGSDLSTARLWKRGRTFKDFQVGDVYDHHWGRTITEAEAVLFASQTLAHNPVYFNVEAAEARGCSAIAVSPYLVLSVVVGLSVEDLSEHSDAFLGMERVEFLEPVRPGDTLYARSRAVDARLSRSRPGFGVVTWKTTGTNQDGEPVVELVRSNLFRIADGAE
jgi:itaconyl-CoA hydratase